MRDDPATAKAKMCTSKLRHGSFLAAMTFATEMAPKKMGAEKHRQRIYICPHCAGFHISVRAARVSVRLPLSPEGARIERDKLIRAGIINGTAPIARQNEPTKLVREVANVIEMPKPKGWLARVKDWFRK